MLLGISILVFGMVQFIPGGPALMLLGENATDEQIAVVNKKLGLDKPLHEQYLVWLAGVCRGDFGRSYQDNREILPDLLDRMPATIELMCAAMLIAICIGVPVGIISAVRRNSLMDNAGRIFALLGVSMPNFWIGLLLILVFAKYLALLPPSGKEGAGSVILPALALGLALAGILMRMVRSSMLEVLKEDYLRTAMSKGLSKRIIVMKHALRNAILPVITTIALQVGNLLGGTVVIESVFAWPGIGRFCYMRMLQRDIPTIMGNLMLYAIIICVLNIITDMIYAMCDPRIRYK